MFRYSLGFAARRLLSAAALWLCACSDSGSTGAGLTDLGAGDLSGGDPGTNDLGTGGTGNISGVHATQAQGRYFPSTAPWYQDVSAAPLAADSSAITQWMVGFAQPNGWGTGKLKVDFSIAAVNVPTGTAKRTFTEDTGFYYEPDCDRAAVG